MPTSYRGQENVQMKIFIMERVATWILTRDRSFVARVRDPFAARARIYKLPVAIVCDALKIAYATEGREPIQRCVLAGEKSAQILEHTNQARRSIGAAQRAAVAARAQILLAVRRALSQWEHSCPHSEPRRRNSGAIAAF